MERVVARHLLRSESGKVRARRKLAMKGTPECEAMKKVGCVRQACIRICGRLAALAK